MSKPFLFLRLNRPVKSAATTSVAMPIISKKMTVWKKEKTQRTYLTVFSLSNRYDGARQPRHDTRQAKPTPSRRKSTGSGSAYHRWGCKPWQRKTNESWTANTMQSTTKRTPERYCIDDRRIETGLKYEKIRWDKTSWAGYVDGGPAKPRFASFESTSPT